MFLGSGPLGRAPTGAVQFNPFYVVQTLGRVTRFGVPKIRVRLKVSTIGRRTQIGAVGSKRLVRVPGIMAGARFGTVVLYGWHDASQTYKNLNYWTTQGRIY